MWFAFDDIARLQFISSIKLVNSKKITKTVCDSVNHCRFPKEDHLPDWVRRDKHGYKGDRVDCRAIYTSLLTKRKQFGLKSVPTFSSDFNHNLVVISTGLHKSHQHQISWKYVQREPRLQMRTDGHDEANSRCSRILPPRVKIGSSHGYANGIVSINYSVCCLP
jgi:hypothetical protein